MKKIVGLLILAFTFLIAAPAFSIDQLKQNVGEDVQCLSVYQDQQEVTVVFEIQQTDYGYETQTVSILLNEQFTFPGEPLTITRPCGFTTNIYFTEKITRGYHSPKFYCTRILWKRH